MIIGIGTDIVQVSRMEAALLRRGEALARRLLTSAELAEFYQHAHPARLLAKRFAAKEAALKAFGTGLRRGLRWRDIGVVHSADGKPQLVFDGVATTLCQPGQRSHVSLADEQDYVVAFVIIESAS
ncbi:MAG: holo-ACP synthase [Gammaproteobacteria bacterium HGW-Gammaproteobacteria-14]|nr:MAG: holo-ACP synthase [Gammaproteobacteria bacterium HGW-Gammaproteobacteria-14]